MKRLYLLILFVIFITSTNKLCHSLDIEEILKDIKDLPIEKITFERKDYEKLKAIQIFVLPKTSEELEKQMKLWKANGVNTLILRVFHNEGDRYHFFLNSDIKKGVYFKTNKAPIIVDALGYFLPIAKNYNFKVFAWMTTRYTDFKNGELEKVIAYSPFKKQFYNAKGINILSSNVQNYIKSLFDDLANYPIDGILFQDDLFLRYNEGLDEKSISRFNSEKGKNLKPENMFIINDNGNTVKYTDDFWEWRRWKSKEIAKFVDLLGKSIKKINPSVKIAVNLTYEAITHPNGALAWLAHDINELKNVSDYFSLMAYHRQIMDELKISLEDSYDYLARMVEKCIELFPDEPERVLFKIQIKDWKTNLAIDDIEIKELLKHTKNINKLSIAIVPYPPEASNEIIKILFSGT